MTATTWRRGCVLARAGLQFPAVVSAALTLAQCSAVPLESGAQPPPPANYGASVAATLRGIKGFSGYVDFQISGLRWAHTASGWNWIACVRFTDHGRQHFYTLFLDAGGVIASRYDVRTDQCATQQYAPLDLAAGTIAAPLMAQPPSGGAVPPPSFTLQQPIY